MFTDPDLRCSVSFPDERGPHTKSLTMILTP